MKRFSELSESEIKDMCNNCVNGIITYADCIDLDLDDLSGDNYNLYIALEKAIIEEWKNSKIKEGKND